MKRPLIFDTEAAALDCARMLETGAPDPNAATLWFFGMLYCVRPHEADVRYTYPHRETYGWKLTPRAYRYMRYYGVEPYMGPE